MSINLVIRTDQSEASEIVWLFSQRQYRELFLPLAGKLNLDLLTRFDCLFIDVEDCQPLLDELGMIITWLIEHENESGSYSVLRDDARKIVEAIHRYQGTDACFSFG